MVMTGIFIATAIGAERFDFGGHLSGELADGGRNLGSADYTKIGRDGRIMHDGSGIAFASGIAAAAAVGSGQGFGDLFHQRIFLDGKYP